MVQWQEEIKKNEEAYKNGYRTIDEIAEEKTGIKVGKVNVDDNQELAVKYNVMSIPTIMIFENGVPKKTFIGVTDKNEILEQLN